MTERLEQIYSEFQNFPTSGTVVRNNIKHDAYTILVFETLFYPYHNIRKFSRDNQDHLDLLKKCIVPPPDDHIDIFYEEDELDEKLYHIVQVKNSSLAPAEIENELVMMEHSISMYLKNPRDISKNLKSVIAETDFSKEYRNKCNYYLIHKGNLKTIRNQKKNHFIYNFLDLERIRKGSLNECVPNATITIDTVNNFIVNNFVENKDGEILGDLSNTKPKSLLCNFNGFDLAELNNLYASSLAGKNILYGQNLRESLGKKSKTFESMFETINSSPELFLFYNNGITILCSDFDAKSFYGKEDITLKNFSIINGAQTTSTLGAYLNDAQINNDLEKIEKLKKVFVLTKIYEINSSLKEHEKIGENIRIYTNTQTPLSNRDMVSIRKEQILAQRRFLDDFDYPNSFITIKNGEKPREYPQLLPYQIITNERLAQLAFAGPLIDPFTAKDKRSKLFDVEQQENSLLNPLYDKIFDQNNGLLFKINNIELDELLFIYMLHEETRKFDKKKLKEQLIKLNQDQITDDVDRRTREKRKDTVKRYQEISGVFIFHNICGYYLLKKHFDTGIDNSKKLVFNSRLYYNDKNFRTELIEAFYELIYLRSRDVIAENSGIGNVQNWTRSHEGGQIFVEKLTEEIIKREFKLSKEYRNFISKFKTLI